ncbi:MAG: DUF3604 domain-containing protein [Firmicutes bacterium]|nr:DUF3604 domain-containing protein [Bacillota bacterium]
MKIYWGDLHGHSEFSRCYWWDYRPGTPDHYYRYAREVAGLDFVALTDHDTSLTDDQWQEVTRKAAEYYRPGHFVTFAAYEWSSWVYGHRNVYYLTEDGPLFRCRGLEAGWEGSDTPADLWNKLRDAGLPVLTIPHHVAVSQFPANWDYHDPEFERLAEITSLWGDFEYYGNPHRAQISDVLPGHYLQDVLARGFRFGFVGGGESHDAHPGSPTFEGRRKPNSLPGVVFTRNPLGLNPVPYLSDEYANWRGLTAILAEELTRESLFHALRERRTYATTGARIDLSLEVEGVMMGGEVALSSAASPRIKATVRGSGQLERVELVKNNRVILRAPLKDSEAAIDWVDREGLGPENYYYLRVYQLDGHKAWSSPVWVKVAEPDNRDSGTEGSSRSKAVPAGGSSSGASFQGPASGEQRMTGDNGFRAKRPPAGETPAISASKKGTHLWTELLTEPLPHLHWARRIWLGGAAGSGGKAGVESGPSGKEARQPVLVHLRFAGGGDPQLFSGTLQISGARAYVVREIGFRTLKYGGDLFTDDYRGQVRWHLSSAGEKGLDLVVYPGPAGETRLTLEAQVADKASPKLWIGGEEAGRPVVSLVL